MSCLLFFLDCKFMSTTIDNKSDIKFSLKYLKNKVQAAKSHILFDFSSTNFKNFENFEFDYLFKTHLNPILKLKYTIANKQTEIKYCKNFTN